MNVSLSAVWANLGLVGLFLATKLVAKFAGVYPVARRYAPAHANFLTLLMSTGLTFGTISALYGLQAGVITGGQFSVLVTVVVLTAVVPTIVAQRSFQPSVGNVFRERRPESPDGLPDAGIGEGGPVVAD
jgi:Kef-type K+ transport system membrane component KefB